MQTEKALRSTDTELAFGHTLPSSSVGKRFRASPARRPARRTEVLSKGSFPPREADAGGPTAAVVERDVGAASVESAAQLSASNGEAQVLPFGRRAVVHDSSALGIYLRQLRQYPVLSREEEHELAVRISRAPDPTLTARLTTANLRLVVKIAREYRRIHGNLLDLIQEGNVGLIHAVRKFDPARGVRLCSYAAWWIRAYILKFIVSNWRLIKVGTTQSQRRLFFNLHKARRKLDVGGAEVDTKQLAEALYVSEKEVIEMERRLNTSELSLDAPGRPDDEHDRTRRPAVSASPSGRPDVQIENSEFASRLRQKIQFFGATLHDRDLEIFRARLNNEEPVTLIELAQQFGVTRERVRQIEARIKKNLRKYLRAELGESVL